MWGYAPAPAVGVVGRVTDDVSGTVGTLLSFNAIEDAEPETLEVPGVLFVRSGWPGPDSPPAWMPAQRTKAMMGLEALERVAHGRTLCLWPRATDAVSDIPSILAFMRAHPAWKLLLDPAALMTPDMQTRADDHGLRMLEALRDHPALIGLVWPRGQALEAVFAPASDALAQRVARLYRD